MPEHSSAVVPCVQVHGILNVSPESFSDGDQVGGATVDTDRGRWLLQQGATVLDIGAVSTHPDAPDISTDEERARLESVLGAFPAARVSVDTATPELQIELAHRVGWLNDIRGFPDPSVWPVLADAPCELVVMHALQEGKADRRRVRPDSILDRVSAFFDVRLESLSRAGVDLDRVWLDPGMGFFLGADPACSREVLRGLPLLAARHGRPLYVSVSRKSFLGRALGGRSVEERGPATLSAELYAIERGASVIRTHDVGALHDAWRVHRWLRDDLTAVRGTLGDGGAT